MYYMIRIARNGEKVNKPEMVGFTDSAPKLGKAMRAAYMPEDVEDALPPTEWTCDQRATPGTRTGIVTKITKVGKGYENFEVATDSDVFLVTPALFNN